MKDDKQSTRLTTSSLQDTVFAQTRLSRVDGESGSLTYCGYDVREFAEQTTFEEVAYLLWSGELPDSGQLSDFKEQSAAARRLPDHILRIACDLPQNTDPIDALRVLVSALGATRSPTRVDAMALTAQIPLLIAAFDRTRRGLDLLTPRADLDTAANFLYLLTGREPTPEQAKALDTYLVLLADQGLSTSTFVARVVASTRADLASCVAAALAALKGPLHGGAAPGRVLTMLEAIGPVDNVEPWIRAALERGERLMGFGQHMYAHTDPRAEVLRAVASAVSDPELFALAHAVEETGERLLRLKFSPALKINIEFYSAVVLHAVGLPKDLFTATFAIGRAAGWSAHILEQAANNRLIRPGAEYAGPSLRSVTPLQERK